MRNVVDFPAPFGPSRPKISPLWTEKDVWSMATKLPKRRTISWASMMVSPDMAGGTLGRDGIPGVSSSVDPALRRRIMKLSSRRGETGVMTAPGR